MSRPWRAGEPWRSALFTDLYELTMAASYHACGLEGRATFDLFVRSLPEQRNFLVVAGVDDCLTFLEQLRFTDDELAYLDSLGLFERGFLEHLAGLRFEGEVRAIPEGELVFGNEPILEVTAPLVQAQLVETFLLNAISTQTMMASKAARVALACEGRPFVEFGARRTHGVDAALRAARAAVIAGAQATSLVEAGHGFGLELSGTMAHSYVMSFEREQDAFLSYARQFGDSAVLLIDTYDTVAGARIAADVARELSAEGIHVRAVRLDSGDLAELAKQVREILDEAGCGEVQIFASGDLDEYRIAELVATGVPVDAFGVGTRMGVSEDHPSLGAVYKLVDGVQGPTLKLSEGKVTLPGRKQVFRIADHDVVSLHDEPMPGGRPLLQPVMVDGERVAAPESIEVMQRRCRDAVAGLPERLRSLAPASPPYDVRLSERLSELADALTKEHQ